MEDMVIEKTLTSEESKQKIKKIKQRKRRSFVRFIYDWVIKSLLIGSILALDFVLFAGAANHNLFAANNITIQALYVLIGILSFAFIAQLLFSFSSFLQNTLTALVFFAAIIMLTNQFALFNKDAFIYNFVNYCLGFDITPYISEPSHILLAAIIGFAFLIYLHFATKSSLAYFTATIITILLGTSVVKFINQNQNTSEFKTIYAEPVKEKHTTPKKYVHIMLPDLASSSYLTELNQDLNNPKLTKAINIKLGFYAKNDFTYYPNAYVWNEEPSANLAQIFNLSDQDYQSFTTSDFKSCCLFDFSKTNNTNTFLKKNKLFDTFKKANYQLNIYQSQGIDFCHENGEKLATKCVEKQSSPINLSQTSISSLEKAKILTAQWFDSMGLWNNMSWLYDAMRLVSEPASMPIIGLSYHNLNTVNSFDALDTAANDIIKDYKNGAYFLYLDMPSNMLVYDENCNLKPSDQWISIQNLPWIKDFNQTKKLEAYAEQSICLYGKMESFINKLNSAGLEKDTVIVIHGLNSSKGLRKSLLSNSVAGFKNNNITEVAIRDPKIKGFAIHYEVCNPAGIINQYLLKQDQCKELTGLGLNDTTMGEIKSNLSIKYPNDKLLENFNYFVDWYNNWGIKSQPITNVKKDLIPIEDANKVLEVKEAAAQQPQLIEPQPAPTPAQ